MCFPGGSEVKNLPVNAGYRFDPWAGTIPWRREWHPTPVFSPGKSHGQRCLMGYSPWGLKRVQHDLLTKTNQAMYQVLYLSGYLLWINPNSEPLTPRSISLFPVFIGTKLATQLTFKEGIRLEKVLWGRESQRKGVLSEGSWRSKAWEARTGCQVQRQEGQGHSTPEEEVTSETHPNWKRTKWFLHVPIRTLRLPEGLARMFAKYYAPIHT